MGKRVSVVRWAGGKTWLAPTVNEMLRCISYNHYYEPFMGGASIYLHLENRQNATISDLNPELVNAFCMVRDEPNSLSELLNVMPNTEKDYYRIRNEKPATVLEQAARFLYLNAFSFNGLYRVNGKGEYNVPYGKRKKSYPIEQLFKVSEKLKNVEIKCQDFEAIENQIQEGDFIFLDPPYVAEKMGERFINYNQKLFSMDDQRRVAKLVETIRDRGAYYILTDGADPDIRALFEKLGSFQVLNRNSMIGGKSAFRGSVPEYMFTNIPEVENHAEN